MGEFSKGGFLMLGAVADTHGLYLNLPVISRDRRIQLSSIDTIW